MKKLSLEQLEREIMEDGFVPSIEKGEIFLLDGEEWICTKSSESRFKARRLRRSEKAS